MIEGWPEGKYSTIYMDPPWSFNDKGSRMAPDCENHFDYHTLSVNQILDLPVASLAGEKAHLYLWVPAAFLAEGILACQRWGFEYKLPLVWVKVSRAGKPRIFAGHYFRHSHELCLFATKNKLGTNTNNTSTVVMAQNLGHSRKPHEFYDLIERNSPGPYIELFARNLRDGWNSWGDEINAMVPIESVNFHNDI